MSASDNPDCEKRDSGAAMLLWVELIAVVVWISDVLA
jgi:hypothetical protein